MRIKSLALTSALVAFGAAGLVAGPSPVFAETVDEQIATLKSLEKSDEGKCVAKMQELKDAGDPKVLDAIKSLTNSKSDKVACAAMKMIASTKNDEFQKTLISKIGNKDLADEKDGRPEIYRTAAEALLSYGEKNKGAAQATAAKFIDKFLATRADYTVRLIRVYGTVRNNKTVDQLLEWAEKCEAGTGGKSGGGGGGGGGGGKGGISQETRDNYSKARNAVLETLGMMTGEDHGDTDGWKKWWGESAKTFKFPELGADGAAAPPPGPKIEEDAAEFKDEGYGYSLKKPAAPGWKWMKAEWDGPRIALNYSPPDDDKYLVARLYVSLHPFKKTKPHDIPGFVQWVKDNCIKGQMDTHDKAPEERQEKLSGYDCTVVIAKGDGIGNKQSWGTIERRFYLVQTESHIYYVDVFVRSGAEEDVKKALWTTAEQMTLPAPPKKK